MDGRSRCLLCRGQLVCHCLLVESNDGLVLIDTGFGLNDVRHPSQRLSALFLALLSPDFKEDMTAVRQIEKLGYSAMDVRHIVLTHLDFDHAGGLDDFPAATVHMLEQERDAAVAQKTWMDRQRFRPQQWSSRPRWKTYQASRGESWFGFQSVRPIEGLDPEILLVPLIGHTLGHCGVAVEGNQRWSLLAGDAYFYARELDPESPYCTPGLRLYQTMLEKDRQQRLTNQARLRRLAAEHQGSIDIFCSHDPTEFERLTGAAKAKGHEDRSR